MRRIVTLGLIGGLTLAAAVVVIGNVGAQECDGAIVVTGMEPRIGFETGGTEVEITIDNPEACTVSNVRFGDTTAQILAVGDDVLTVRAPAGTGVVTPGLRYGDGQSAEALAFTYVPVPRLDRMLPPSGPVSGGKKVIMWGGDLSHPSATTEVAFGDDLVSPDNLTSDELTVRSPAAEPGEVEVAVVLTLTNGESASSDTVPFTIVAAPRVDEIEPISGSAEGGEIITITGAHFQRGVTVLMGPSDGSSDPTADRSRFGENRVAAVVEYVDDENLRAIVPAGTPGPASVVVLNPDQQFGALTDGYTYAGDFPIVTATEPRSGPSLGGTRVTLTGTGFVAGLNVYFGGQDQRTRASVESVTATAVVVVTPAVPAGSVPVPVTVVNPDGGSSTTAGAYTYQASAAPTLEPLPPTTGTSLGGATLTLEGSGFATGAIVRFGAPEGAEECTRGLVPALTSCSDVAAAVVDGSRLTVTTPPRPAGATPVRVINPDQQASGSRTFTYEAASPPAIVGTIEGSSGPTRGGTIIRIWGSGFATGARVLVGGTEVTAEFDPNAGLLAVVRPDGEIVGVTPPGVAGLADITVTNPDGATATRTGGFEYLGPPPPVLTSIEPSSGTSAGGLEVVLTGEDFADGSVVTFGNAECDSGEPACNLRAAAADTVVGTLEDGSTTITTRTPPGLYGFVDVAVVGPDGTTTVIPYGFESVPAPAPTFDEISPERGPTGSVVTISGAGFVKGAETYIGTQRVRGIIETDDGDSVELPTVCDDETIVGVVPRRSGGTFLVAVANPDRQGVIVPEAFSYPVDTTPPVASATASTGTPPVEHEFGEDNWALGPVTVVVTAVDEAGGSGVDTITYWATGAQTIEATTVSGPSASFPVTAQGLTTISFSATDIAGNTSSPVDQVVAIDSVRPAVGATSDFVRGTQVNTPVEVEFACADAPPGSGVGDSPMTFVSDIGSVFTTDGSNPATVTFTEDGIGQSVTARCTDIAGNVGTRTFGGVNITRDGPVLEVTATTADGRPYEPGEWTNLNVVVTFKCRAPESIAAPRKPQVAFVTPAVVVSTDVTDLSVEGECRDTAGNIVTGSFDEIYIDKTPPVMGVSAATPDGQPYTAGQWTNQPVVVTFTCTEVGEHRSGVDVFSDPVTIDTDGRTAGVSGTCIDNAGNHADPAVFLGPILIDTVAPTCSVTVTPNPIGPPNRQLRLVVAAVRAADDRSGVEEFTLVSVVSSSPATAGSDIVGFVPGTASTTGSLRTTRGNVYTFTYVARDRAGNESEPCTVAVSVR